MAVVVKTHKTPGEHQRRQMDVHPQNGIAIGYATHGHMGKFYGSSPGVGGSFVSLLRPPPHPPAIQERKDRTTLLKLGFSRKALLSHWYSFRSKCFHADDHGQCRNPVGSVSSAACARKTRDVLSSRSLHLSLLSAKLGLGRSAMSGMVQVLCFGIDSKLSTWCAWILPTEHQN